MILVVDAGNSRLKWGLAAPGANVLGGDWAHCGALENSRLGELSLRWAALPQPATVLCANVAGAASAAAIRTALAPWGVDAAFLRPQERAAGVVNRYDEPAQLGADRWASAIAAWQRRRSACIVVNAGTATTIDFVSAAAEFLGGMILPGVTLMKQALQRGTAGLGLQEGKIDLQSRNTADAIASGCLFAQIGAIECARRGFAAGAPVLLSGGAAALLSGRIAAPCEELPSLALEGLFILASAGGLQA